MKQIISLRSSGCIIDKVEASLGIFLLLIRLSMSLLAMSMSLLAMSMSVSNLKRYFILPCHSF